MSGIPDIFLVNEDTCLEYHEKVWNSRQLSGITDLVVLNDEGCLEFQTCSWLTKTVVWNTRKELNSRQLNDEGCLEPSKTRKDIESLITPLRAFQDP